MSANTEPGRCRAAITAAAAAAMLVVAGCSSAVESGSLSSAGAGSLTIAVDNGSPTLQDNFSPFSPNQRSGTPYMYEPLEYVNPLNGAYTPFLASGHSFAGTKTLRFTIRSGARWSDGKPLTAADVVYTFKLLKQHAALDSAGVWQHLSSVSASGNAVTFQFSSADVPFAQAIAQTLIVPQHIWSKVANPVTFTNPHPVVSGPYKLQSFNPNKYVLTRNSDCWQASQAKVGQLVFPALTGNQSSQLELASGDYSWASVFVPDIRHTDQGRLRRGRVAAGEPAVRRRCRLPQRAARDHDHRLGAWRLGAQHAQQHDQHPRRGLRDVRRGQRAARAHRGAAVRGAERAAAGPAPRRSTSGSMT